MRGGKRSLFVELGQRIGRGVVIEPEVRVRSRPDRPAGMGRGARLLCDCGNVYEDLISRLVGTGPKPRRMSCGCGNRGRPPGNRTHGMTRTPTYTSWSAMKARCLNPRDPYYADYGGRGITVCERWLRFDAFFADMGERPRGRTLDRIDANGNYEAGNCRWATYKEQTHNTREPRQYCWSPAIASRDEIRGKFASGDWSMKKLAREYGVSEKTIARWIEGITPPKRSWGGSSAFRGVSLIRRGGRWLAYIQVEGQRIPLGRHDTEVGAALAYDSAARRYHGDAARLNFPEEAA